MRNRLSYTFWFTLLVIAGIQSLRYLPKITVGERTLRKVDLISAVRSDKPVETVASEEVVQDSLLALAPDTIDVPEEPDHHKRTVFLPEDTAQVDFTRIEEFLDSMGDGGMRNFYEAMANIETLGRPVRIAYFGDSFIEGDILTADLRAMLQQKFGGCGVGYVPVTNKNPHFRPTVTHKFSGWESHIVTDKKGFDSSLQDIYCRYFFPDGTETASVTLQGQRRYASLLDTCELSRFYFVAPDSTIITARINGGEPQRFCVEGDSTMRALTVEGRIGEVTWTVEKADSTARFFAATMDAYDGIALDNFNIRGSNGTKLANIPMSTLKSYDRLRTYDLVVLQYGLNVASEKSQNYTYYTVGMTKVIRHLKNAFPEASILIVGVSDRDKKDEETGEMRTMIGVRELMTDQRWLAKESNTAFWNLFEAMGGEGSIREMAEGTPQLANFDYTHINFRGGRRLAGILFKAIVYGCERYKKYADYEELQDDDI